MIPIVTPEEMAAIDHAAPEPTSELIMRAGAAVARVAISMLGGAYGRRVVVLVGPGNNGNDGRDAARRLEGRGVRVNVIPVAEAPGILPACDLVIDAAFGTGFHGDYTAPAVHSDTPVLAVDIPSGVDGLTGAASGRVLRANATVTFAALKPGLLAYPGSALAGVVEVVDIGLNATSARCALLESTDVARWFPARDALAHKWQSAVWVIAGSPGMQGAGVLVAAAAQRSGAGYVRQSSPGTGTSASSAMPVEVVQTQLPDQQWAQPVIHDHGRFAALAIGNGLGLGPNVGDNIRALVSGVSTPMVVDADAISALGLEASQFTGPHVVLTPHDGEFARLAGKPPGPNRIDATCELAGRLHCVVVLKGQMTVVASPDGDAYVINSGDVRLATAGTGDVLAGVIAALMARGLAPFEAASAGAFLHGAASALGWADGLVASDVVGLLPAAIDQIYEAAAQL